MFDAGSPAAALGYGIGRIGCLLSGDGDYGKPTSLPWGMSFPNGLVPTTERVHPTPIYELIVACAIAWLLWRMGARQIQRRARGDASVRVASSAVGKDAKTLRAQAGQAANQSASGLIAARPGEPVRQTAGASSRTPHDAVLLGMGGVFAAYLVLTGAARFLVEFIRINPRSFLGMTNAQAASAVSVIAGAALWWHVARADAPARR
jgi:prolipoprotein diacylglyceryltransferase